MKAVRYTQYGPPDVLELVEVPTPAPQEDEVLLRIRAASVNPIDWHFMRGSPYVMRIQSGLRRPTETSLGIDAAGQVEAVGRDVEDFQPGDEVFGGCKGAFAEYVCASQSVLVHKPANVTFEQAAAVPVAGLSALQALRDTGRIQRSQKVLINGAAGGVGTFAVQIAKVFGANVTGVCSTRNVDMVRSIGADQVIDYTREDFTENRKRYDLILDMIGNHSLSHRRRALTPEGTLVLVGGADEGRWLGPLADPLKAIAVSRFVRHKLRLFLARSNRDDLKWMREHLEDGSVTPVIDRVYPFSDVAEAIRYLEEGHARGKIVLSLAPANTPGPKHGPTRSFP